MVNRRDLDPTKSAKTHYGHRLRKYREARGWTQPRLADEACCSPDLISKIELGTRVATRPTSVRFDEIFGLADEFTDLQPLAAKEIIPWWFRPYTEFETVASSIRIFDPLHIPGLLQIESYARLILASRYTSDALDQVVTARINRQEILARKPPPWLIVMIAEWALQRPVADPAVKRAQLQHLLDMTERERVRIQIVPSSAPDYTSGAFTLFSFSDEPDLGFVQTVKNFGRPIDKHEEVEELRVKFDLIRVSALTAEDSVELIRTTLENL